MFLIFSIIVWVFIGFAVSITVLAIWSDALEGMKGLGLAELLIFVDGGAIVAFVLWTIILVIRGSLHVMNGTPFF